MIKFFRKIRQQLLNQGKISKYLLYAIGEIFLVVIGILIAIQVNNWNNNKILEKNEIIILKEIVQNLKFDLEDFSRNYTHFKNVQIASRNLIDVVDQNGNYNDSLAFHLFFVGSVPYFSPVISGYKLLESKGVDIISNDSLRQYITQTYDSWYPRMIESERDNRAYLQENLHKLRNKYLGTVSIFKDKQPNSLEENEQFNRIISSGSIRRLVNFEDFKKDTELLNAIKDAEVRTNLEYDIHLWRESGIRALIKEIEKEIEKDQVNKQ